MKFRPDRIRTIDKILFGILAAYTVYATLFIFNTSFIIEGKRYFSLFDDMMISMRYAKHFAAGHGLVWNIGGERVEGYTNLGWVLFMALFHRLPLDPARISFYIQASGAVFLAINLVFVQKIAYHLSGQSLFATAIAVVFTAFYLPLNNWGLQGTEVSILTLTVTLAVWLQLRAARRERHTVLPYLLLGAGTIIRTDMVVPYLAVLSYSMLADTRSLKRHLAEGTLILAVFLGAQTLFRYWYYGELLPNTYYLKMTGYPVALRIERGLKLAYETSTQLGILGFGILVLRPRKHLFLLAWLFVGQLLYSAYVGGDAWEWYGGTNRYVSITVPLYFILLGCTFGELARVLAAGFRQLALDTRMIWVGLAVLSAFNFVSYNAIYGADALAEWTLAKPPMQVSDSKAMIEQALVLKKITAPDATVGVVLAGTLPYFSERPAIDLLGKNDKTIARVPMDREFSPFFYPGHLKWDYAYSIGELKPDIVIEFWRDPQTALRYLEDYEPVWLVNENVYMRKESPRIYWDRFR